MSFRRATLGISSIEFPSILELLRPHQWVKNLTCFAGVFFGGQLLEPSSVGVALGVTFTFCLTSSCVYIFNDMADFERDRLHNKKRHRPIASQRISFSLAATIGIILFIGAMVAALFIGNSLIYFVAMYLINNILYSTTLKNVALLDIFSIAFGFVIRVLASVYALSLKPTAWIVLCVFFLSVLLAAAKRRAEIAKTIESDLSNLSAQRPVLANYSVEFLDNCLNAAATMAIISYAIFTTLPEKNSTLVITVPFVYYAITHYKRTVTMLGAGEEPEKILVKDYHMVGSIACWIMTYFVISYGNISIFD